MTNQSKDTAGAVERAREALEILVVTYAMDDAQHALKLEAAIKPFLAAPSPTSAENAQVASPPGGGVSSSRDHDLGTGSALEGEH